LAGLPQNPEAWLLTAARRSLIDVNRHQNVVRGESAPSTRGEATTRDAAEYSDASAPELFIEVADAEAKPVYLSATAFPPVLGSATYQNVVLPAGGQALGDLPAEIRKVAIPKPERAAAPKTEKVAGPKRKKKS
jgi:hypothetical protein